MLPVSVCIGSSAFFLSSKLGKLQNSKLNVSSASQHIAANGSIIEFELKKKKHNEPIFVELECMHTCDRHKDTPFEIAQQVESFVIDLHNDSRLKF